MTEKLTNIIVDKFLLKDENDPERREILCFGITRILEDIPKTIGIFLTGLMLSIVKEMLVVSAILIGYKTFVGGLHVKTNFACFIYSLLFYLVIIYTAQFIVFESILYLYICLFIFAVYCILVYAPADVPEIPKVNEKLRRNLKIKSIISLVILYIVALVSKDMYFANLIIYSIFFTNVMTTRTMYKIFKNEYGYETYVPDELL